MNYKMTMMKVVVILLLLPAILVAKPSRNAFEYDIPDLEDDAGPPAPMGDPFLETEDAFDSILRDNDHIEQLIANGTLRRVLEDGDIYNPIRNDSSRHKRNAVRDRQSLWPGGLVPYVLSPYFRTDSKLAVLAAMQRFHEKTCIRFRPRTIERDFIYLGPGNGCWSLVGRQGAQQTVSLGASCKTKRGTIMHELMHVLGFRHEHNRPDRDRHVTIYWHNIGKSRIGGEQTVSLGSTCKTKRGTIMHEFMHVLGFRHEHNRPDRDGHVIIYWENIAGRMEDNFKKYDYRHVNLLDVGYDFGSIMHYPMYAFSKNGAATLSPRYTTYKEVGFRNDFSDMDVYKINALYKCGVCQDTDHNHCPVWAMGGSCYRNREWMSKNCAFSCFMCKPTSYGACTDYETGCSSWARSGECERNPKYMEGRCPLSCQACPMDARNMQKEMKGCHDKNTLCYDWALIGECQANKGYMSKTCRLSCAFCDDEEIAAIGRKYNDDYCHDSTDLCKDWAYHGECTRNKGFMRKKCKLTCSSCKPGDIYPDPWVFFKDDKCKNKHPSCSSWAKHGLCETYSSWMVPNCPFSCKNCPNTTDNDTLSHLRPTLSSQLNTWNLTGLVSSGNTTDVNMTIPEGVEIQPFEALGPFDLEVVPATEPPLEILTLQNNDSTECQDRDGRCVIWADEGRCRKANRFMFDYCRYSCRLCGVNEFQLKDVCRDIHGFCSIYAEEGDCDANEEWMRIYCKKSCDLCKRSALTKESTALTCGDRSTRCSLMVGRGDCEKSPARMKVACPRSCGFCGVKPKTEDCRDRNKRCHKWAKNGDCTKYASWMRVNCPLSCDTCDALTNNRECLDVYRKCPTYAAAGECETYPDWMKTNCRFSCDSCTFKLTNPGCTDRFKRCRPQADNGACTYNLTEKWMAKNCHRSCNLCEEKHKTLPQIEYAPGDPGGNYIAGDCRDRSPHCPKWAEINQCHYNPTVMRQECKESCGLCPTIPVCYDKGDRKQCKRWAWMGECISNPDGIKNMCKKSCGHCGRREGCTNLNKRCIKWAKAGQCKKVKTKKFMSKFCAPACGICTPSPEETETNLLGSAGTNKNKAGKIAKSKALAITTQQATTQTPTTPPPPKPPTEEPPKPAKKNKKNKKKTNRKKNKNKSGTQQLRPDGDLLPAVRAKAERKHARKLARARARLEKAQNVTRLMEEKRNNATVIETIQVTDLTGLNNPLEIQVDPTMEIVTSLHDIIDSVEGQFNPVEEQVNPVEEQSNPVQVDFSGKASQIIDDQVDPTMEIVTSLHEIIDSVEGQTDPVDEINPVEEQVNPVREKETIPVTDLTGQNNPLEIQVDPTMEIVTSLHDIIASVEGQTNPVEEINPVEEQVYPVLEIQVDPTMEIVTSLHDVIASVEGQINPVEEINPVEAQVNPVQEQLHQVEEEQVDPIEEQINPVVEQVNPVEEQVNPVQVDFSGKASQVMDDQANYNNSREENTGTL